MDWLSGKMFRHPINFESYCIKFSLRLTRGCSALHFNSFSSLNLKCFPFISFIKYKFLNNFNKLHGNLFIAFLKNSMRQNISLAKSWKNTELFANKNADTSVDQEGRGHWDVYYTSSQSFIMNFSYSLP